MRVKKDSSKKILQSISVFGGLQLFLILVNLLKVKALAIFVGVSGVGQFSIYNNILNLTVQFASLGLNFSAIRYISLSFEKGNQVGLTKTFSIFKYWSYACAVFGLLISFIPSRYISILSFDSPNNTYIIMVLSIGIFFTILYNSNIAFLQGIRELKSIAKSSFFSGFVGLIFSIPLFYYYQQKGIVISIIISALLSFIVSYFFVKKTGFRTVKLKPIEIYEGAGDMVKLGLVMMVSSFIGTAVIYLINIFIVKQGSIEDLGLFSAGNGITNQYVGLIFAAMAADYFPKLSSISTNRKKVNNLVNNQGEILILIVCPILIILMSFSSFIIKILLSVKFISITNFIAIMSVAMLFKTAAFPIGYISFAKGDKKVFFLFEGIINSLLILSGHILGYYLGGVTGIACGLLLLYIIYFFAVTILSSIRYKFVLGIEYKKILIVSCFFLLIGVLNYFLVADLLRYIIALVLLLISTSFSWIKMNERIPINLYFISKINLLKNK